MWPFNAVCVCVSVWECVCECVCVCVCVWCVNSPGCRGYRSRYSGGRVSSRPSRVGWWFVIIKNVLLGYYGIQCTEPRGDAEQEGMPNRRGCWTQKGCRTGGDAEQEGMLNPEGMPNRRGCWTQRGSRTGGEAEQEGMPNRRGCRTQRGCRTGEEARGSADPERRLKSKYV